LLRGLQPMGIDKNDGAFGPILHGPDGPLPFSSNLLGNCAYIVSSLRIITLVNFSFRIDITELTLGQCNYLSSIRIKG
ncbi:hypothetical protein HN873_010843, partial [Arachis hypogaea]